MRSLLASAAITAGLLVPLCLYAQPRGAAHSSFSGFRGSYRSYSVAPRTPPRPWPARTPTSRSSYFHVAFPPVTGSSLINPGEASCLLNPSYSGSFYCRQYFPRGPYLGFEPVYPYWFPTPGYESDQPAPEAAEPEPDPLAAQVGNLTAEVEMLREDQALRDSRGARAPQSPAASEEKLPTTLLVYRDGHQVEVQDYAILGKTLWVFSDQTTRQVPLADLDLAATQHVMESAASNSTPPPSNKLPSN